MSRSRRAKRVEGADNTRPVASRCKRMRECRLGALASAVSRWDDTRPDTIREITDCRFDPRLHGLASQVISAEDDVDLLAPERTLRASPRRSITCFGMTAREGTARPTAEKWPLRMVIMLATVLRAAIVWMRPLTSIRSSAGPSPGEATCGT